jgi:hypothetical protein
MDLKNAQPGPPLALLQNVSCLDSFEYSPSDALVAVYCDDSGDAGTVLRRSVFQANGDVILSEVLADESHLSVATHSTIAPSGEWLFATPALAGVPYSPIVTHVPDGAAHGVGATIGDGFFAFDHGGKFLYYQPPLSDVNAASLERFSLSDFSTTLLTESAGSCGEISPDDRFAQCSAGLISTQTGAVTLLPQYVEGFTDDWSYVLFLTPTSTSASDNVWDVWAEPVGGNMQVSLAKYSLGNNNFSVTSLSDSTLLVRDFGTVRVFDTSGKTPPVLVVAASILGESPLLSSDRKRAVYASVDAPAGLYVVELP